jgi:hypothetical protein
VGIAHVLELFFVTHMRFAVQAARASASQEFGRAVSGSCFNSITFCDVICVPVLSCRIFLLAVLLK